MSAGMRTAVHDTRQGSDPSVTVRELEDAVTNFMDAAKTKDLCGLCTDLTCGLTWRSAPKKSVAAIAALRGLWENLLALCPNGTPPRSYDIGQDIREGAPHQTRRRIRQELSREITQRFTLDDRREISQAFRQGSATR